MSATLVCLEEVNFFVPTWSFCNAKAVIHVNDVLLFAGILPHLDLFTEEQNLQLVILSGNERKYRHILQRIMQGRLRTRTMMSVAVPRLFVLPSTLFTSVRWKRPGARPGAVLWSSATRFRAGAPFSPRTPTSIYWKWKTQMYIGYVMVLPVHICFLVSPIRIILSSSACLVNFRYCTTSIVSFFTSSNSVLIFYKEWQVTDQPRSHIYL